MTHDLHRPRRSCSPFNGWAIYDWQPQKGHWALIAFINSEHDCSDDLKNAVKAILSIGVKSSEEPRVWSYRKGDCVESIIEA